VFLGVRFIIIISVGFSLILSSSPVVLNIFILFLSLVVSVYMGFIICSWSGYIIFLIYISGMLIIFIYFSAIQPNQRLYIKFVFCSVFLFLLFTPLYLYPIIGDIALEGALHVTYFSMVVCKII